MQILSRQEDEFPVLLVEDDIVLARALCEVLHGSGMPVDHCQTGEVAIELMKNRRYCMLIVDLILPEGVSGTYVINAMRRSYPDGRPPVLMITGASLESCRGIDRSAVAAIMFKPLDLQLFAAYARATYDHACRKLGG